MKLDNLHIKNMTFINMKNKISFCLLLVILLSCNKKPTHKLTDKDYEKMSKIKDENLTKIVVPAIISLDTINDNEKEIVITIKNVGKKDLKSLVVRPYCSCINVPKYDSVIKPQTDQRITLNIPIDEKGNFSKPIFIYGNFYPYIRTILIEGYRKN